MHKEREIPCPGSLLSKQEWRAAFRKKGLQATFKASGKQGSREAETRGVQSSQTQQGKQALNSGLDQNLSNHHQSSILEHGVLLVICVFWELLYKLTKRQGETFRQLENQAQKRGFTCNNPLHRCLSGINIKIKPWKEVCITFQSCFSV